MNYRHTSILLVLFSLLLGVLQIPSCHARKESVEETPAQVSIDVLQKALIYVKDHNYGNAKTLKSLEDRDVHTLYEVAKAMNGSKVNAEMLASIEVWDALAEGGHTLSQVALGFAYSENDKAKAIAYFVAAGESGPHQAALFNAGRLLADPEIGDYVKSLAYMRAAYQMGENHPHHSTAHMVETSKVGYERLSEEFIDVINEAISKKGSMLSIQHIADMFLYANLNNFPPAKTRSLRDWGKAMRAMQFNEFELAYVEFGLFEETYEDKTTDLQKTIITALKKYCEAAAVDQEL